MTELFNIGLEADLSEFDSLVSDGGDLYHDTPGLVDSAGKMACLIDDTTAIYGRKDVVLTTNRIRARVYFDPNTLGIINSDQMAICLVRLSGGPPVVLANITIRDNSGNLAVRVRAVEDGAVWNNGALVNLSGSEQYFEFDLKRATTDVASDGSIDLYIDGVFANDITGLDNYDIWDNIIAMDFGARLVEADVSGLFFLDEFVANDDGTEIGEYVPPPDLQPVTLRRMVHYNYSYLMNLVWGIGSDVYTLSETTAQLCLTLLSTFPAWQDYWVGYDGYDWYDDILEDIVAKAIGELIPD